jgi:formylmethanofuran dehydrogenase subunit E
MQGFETLLRGSADAHCHLCPGQVVGVRMAMLGCDLIGLDNPREMPQIKKLIVYVEIDRCAADAIAYVTGVKLGRRSLKFMDYGIMAATFVNLQTRLAYRVVSTESARELTAAYAPEIDDPHRQQLEAYIRMPDEVLFDVQRVSVDVPITDMPGPSRFKAICERCGQVVRDKKEVLKGGQVLCRPCAQGAYFRPFKRQGTVDSGKSTGFMAERADRAGKSTLRPAFDTIQSGF